jgi:hypothetical protein
VGGGAAFIGGDLGAREARGSSDLLGLPSASSIIHFPSSYPAVRRCAFGGGGGDDEWGGGLVGRGREAIGTEKEGHGGVWWVDVVHPP